MATNTTHTLVFREENGNPRCMFATTTPAYRKDTEVCLQITDGSEAFPMEELDVNEVEELHQFTYEILAGRPRDPRLIVDADIYCGAETDSPSNGHLECTLVDGHSPVGAFGHVDRYGVLFDTPGAF